MPDSLPPHRIDLHAHYLAPDYRDALTTAGIHMIGGLPTPDWSPDLALEFMDAHGIAVQILSVSDPALSFLPSADRPALARACNSYVSHVVTEHPTRFGALALLPMPDIEESVAALRYALDHLHHDGAALLSSYDGTYLGHPKLDPLLAELDARNAWTFVHPTAVPTDNTPGLPIPDFIAEYPFDTTRAILSLIFNGSFEKYPNIRWQFAHGGGTIPMLVPRVEALGAVASAVGPLIGLPEGSARLNEASVHRALTGSYYDTALIAAPGPLAAIADTAGAGQLVFGSDWPFAARLYPDDGDPQPALSRAFTTQQREAIERTTAARELPRTHTQKAKSSALAADGGTKKQRDRRDP